MAAKETIKLNINGLIPNEKYVVQVRAVDGKEESEWSQKFHFKTDSDKEGTGGPSVPQNVVWVQGPESVIAQWDTVTENVNGTPSNVTKYEVEVSGDLGGGPIVNQSALLVSNHGLGIEQKPYSVSNIMSIFGGYIPDTVYLRVRTVNSGGSRSDWSAIASILIGKPDPPTDAVPPPTAASIVDAVKLAWTPPVNLANVAGYVVYVGITSDFVPSATKKIYQGPSPTATHNTIAYDVTQYYKIRAYSLFGKESDDLLAEGKPKSPYGPDTVPPLQPTLAAPTMDRTTLTAPKVNLTWTINEAAEENEDISGFVIRWRITGDTNWRTNYFDKTARAGVIDIPRPFSNYQFEISAYDFVANYSAYAGTLQTLTGASAPPLQTTGVDSVPRWDGLRIVWNESTSEAVKYTGGRYEVQLRSTNSFPADTPVEYTTANTFIDVAGLASLSTWYYRVRAVDSANQAGPWSIVDSVTLPAFPVASASDGIAPTSAPANPRVTGGLNYVNVSWDRVTNADAVFYEVYVDDAASVTAIAGNFAGQSSGTSLMVTNLPDGSPLMQETEYFFKVRAVDIDGPGPLSAEVSTELTQVLSTDLGINMGGENLLYNSSLDVDSDANGLANYWQVVNDSSGTEPHTATLVAGMTGTFAQRVAWTGVNSSTKGIKSNGASILRKNTEYVVSFYARSNGGTGFNVKSTPALLSVVAVDNPTPHATNWQRYIFKVVTGATVDANNITMYVVGNTVSGGWLEIDDAQIEAGNLASAYKTGTVSIAKLATGKFETADMIIATGGRIVSQTYLNNPNTGFLITDAGITIKDGQIDAKNLIANTTVTSNLYVGALLEVATGGAIRSANYSTAGAGAGFRIDSVGIDIRSGTVAAGTFSAGTITSPAIVLGANGKITVDSTGSIQSNNYANGTTGWKISNLGIEMWDVNSKINVNALETSTLTTTTLTIGSGGVIQSSTWAGGSGARWQLSENAFTMHNGAITGSTIITNQLYSMTDVPNPAGGTRKSFSINTDGYAELTGARIYGNLIVSNSSVHRVTSENFNPGYSGWQIRGDGVANFNSLGVGGGGGQDYMVVESLGGKAYIRLFRGSDGVLLGDFKSSTYGVTLASPSSSLDLTGPNVYVNGGLVISGSVYTTQTVTAGQLTGSNITSHTNIAAGHTFNAASMPWAGANARYVMVGDDGWFTKGPVSSERYKHSISTLETSVENVLALEPKQFKYNHDGENATFVTGFLAEQAHEAGLTEWVDYTEIDGKIVPDGFRYPEFLSAHQLVLRAHQQEIAELKSRLELLESRA